MDGELKSKIRDFLLTEFATPLRSKLSSGFSLDDFNIQPFILVAVSSGVFGEASAINMSRALIYPRILGTTVNTRFGDKMQKLCVDYLDVEGSGVPGMDFQYTDKKDSKRVYMQLKSGPNTLNADDVNPMIEKMRDAYRLLLQNRVQRKRMPLFAVGVVYGSSDELSGHYRKISNSSIYGQLKVPIYVGKDLWYRITGDENFYFSLVNLFVDVFEEEDYSNDLDRCIKSLAKEIEHRFFRKGTFDAGKL